MINLFAFSNCGSLFEGHGIINSSEDNNRQVLVACSSKGVELDFWLLSNYNPAKSMDPYRFEPLRNVVIASHGSSYSISFLYLSQECGWVNLHHPVSCPPGQAQLKVRSGPDIVIVKISSPFSHFEPLLWS